MRLNIVSVVSILKQKDMKQKVLAEKTGLTQTTISMICNGKSCSEETARKIATALGVTVDELTETKAGGNIR